MKYHAMYLLARAEGPYMSGLKATDTHLTYGAESLPPRPSLSALWAGAGWPGGGGQAKQP
jgi:hypothetical protein